MNELDLLKNDKDIFIPSKTIYVVFGSTGDEEDKNEWIVAGFEDEQIAKDFIIACKDEAIRIVKELASKGIKSWDYDEAVQSNKVDKHKYDPYFHSEDSEFSYRFETVKILMEF